MGKYPEHDKLAARREESQTISEFIDFLTEHGIHFGFYHEHNDNLCWADEDDRCQMSSFYLNDWNKTPEQVIGLFLDIDPKKLSAEKDAMYRELRANALAAEGKA